MIAMHFQFRFRTIFLWIIYGLTLTGLLLYVRFPAEVFRQFTADYVELLFPGTDCKIGSLSYSFPLTVKAVDIRLSSLEAPEEVFFETTSLAIRPQLRYPVKDFALSGEMYGGSQSCMLRLQEEKGAFTLRELEVTNLELKQLQYLQKLLGRSLTGKMKLFAEYHGRIGRLMQGEAKGKIELIEGSMELLQPVLSLNRIDLKRSALEFHLKEMEFIVENGMFDGKELKGTFSGGVGLEERLLESELDITGDLEVSNSLLVGNTRVKSIVKSLQRRHKRTTLPFNVNGLVNGPLFRFGI